MDYMKFVYFFVNDLLFSFTIVLLTFTISWILYDVIVLRKINLRKSLFENNNMAGWIEFIGAFIFPTLFLASKAIEGSASSNIITDLLISSLYVTVYIVLLTLLRLVSNLIVRFISPEDIQGKINLNNEIYIQNNIAAALFSTALSIVFVSMIRFLNFGYGEVYISLLKVSNIIVFTLLAFLVYCMFLRYKTSILKELFGDNNIAAGVDLLGFIFAIEIILVNAVALQIEFNFTELIILSFISLLVFGIISALFKLLFVKIITLGAVNEIRKEENLGTSSMLKLVSSKAVNFSATFQIYELNNIGVAIGQSAIYIGIANIIVHFIK